MPDRTRLTGGDRIRLLSVPQCDLDRRRREVAEGIVDPGSTATVIERMIAEKPIVTIDRIDEFGAPWFDVELAEPDGTHFHSLTILDDDSWEGAE